MAKMDHHHLLSTAQALRREQVWTGLNDSYRPNSPGCINPVVVHKFRTDIPVPIVGPTLVTSPNSSIVPLCRQSAPHSLDRDGPVWLNSYHLMSQVMTVLPKYRHPQVLMIDCSAMILLAPVLPTWWFFMYFLFEVTLIGRMPWEVPFDQCHIESWMQFLVYIQTFFVSFPTAIWPIISNYSRYSLDCNQ